MNYWKISVYSALTGHWAIESYIQYRQLLALKDRKLPSRIRSLFNQTTIDKSLEYSKDRLMFLISRNLFNVLFTVTILHLNAYKSFWNLSGTILNWFSTNSAASPIGQALICQAIQLGIGAIKAIPFDLYDTFVVEEKHGLNKSTLRTFWSDTLMSFIINTAFQSVLMAGLLKAIHIGGDSFLPYVSAVIAIFFCFAFSVFPLVILPLFYKLSPLEDGELKSTINKLAATQKFPSENIYVCDGSKRSSHSNAFFIGLPWSKKIVIFDTLVETSTPDEIAAVLAHEVGHWKNNDLIRLMISAVADITALFYIFSLVYKTPGLYNAFGFTDTFPVYIGYTLFENLSKFTVFLSKITSNAYTRKLEYKADKFAASLGYSASLGTALIKLNSNNLHATNEDWFYSVYSHSHPSLSERLSALDGFDKQK